MNSVLKLSATLWGVALLAGCGSDYSVDVGEGPTPNPPPIAQSDYGAAPDWETCFGGYHSRYFNIPSSHSALEPRQGEDTISLVEDPQTLDFFDDVNLSFSQYDSSLDVGPNWWPVDDGFQGDPAYFAVRSLAWINVRETLDWSISIGAADDIWIVIDRKIQVSLPGDGTFEPKVFSLRLKEGQYPIEIYFSNRRAASSALSFRNLSADGVQICYPDLE